MNSGKSKSNAQLMPAVPIAAVLSFLKDTRGLDTWTAHDLSKTLAISAADTTKVITLLELQGYVKTSSESSGKSRAYFTTAEGQAVSGSKAPHFTRERVEKALDALKERITAARKDFKASFKVSSAIAFGDFLREGARVQAPDVGIELAQRKSGDNAKLSATESKTRAEFLKQLRGKNAPLNVLSYEDWMGKRSHRKLV
jgi:DNA-binding MarR family transcriptional regulator